jgi:hypothetical protein
MGAKENKFNTKILAIKNSLDFLFILLKLIGICWIKMKNELL